MWVGGLLTVLRAGLATRFYDLLYASLFSAFLYYFGGVFGCCTVRSHLLQYNDNIDFSNAPPKINPLATTTYCIYTNTTHTHTYTHTHTPTTLWIRFVKRLMMARLPTDRPTDRPTSAGTREWHHNRELSFPTSRPKISSPPDTTNIWQRIVSYRSTHTKHRHQIILWFVRPTIYIDEEDNTDIQYMSSTINRMKRNDQKTKGRAGKWRENNSVHILPSHREYRQRPYIQYSSIVRYRRQRTLSLQQKPSSAHTVLATKQWHRDNDNPVQWNAIASTIQPPENKTNATTTTTTSSSPTYGTIGRIEQDTYATTTTTTTPTVSCFLLRCYFFAQYMPIGFLLYCPCA